MRMNKLFSMVAGAALAVCGSAAFAAPIDTTGYTVTNLESAAGFAYYDVSVDIFTATDLGGLMAVDSDAPISNASATLSYAGLGPILGPAIESSIMTESAQFLFADGATRYLVTVDATGSGADFTDADPFAFYDVDADITLDRLDLIADVPLPASLPLVVIGMAGFAMVTRRKSRR